jgi:hypothetical protein
LFFQHGEFKIVNPKNVSTAKQFITESLKPMKCINVVGRIPRRRAQYQ